MKTDPTAKISGAAGTPLSHAAIEFGRHDAQRFVARAKSKDTISDTLETTDREADGRRPMESDVSPPSRPHESHDPQVATGDQLDLTG